MDLPKIVETEARISEFTQLKQGARAIKTDPTLT